MPSSSLRSPIVSDLRLGGGGGLRHHPPAASDLTGIVLRSLAAGLAVACSFIRSNVVIEFYEPLTDEEDPHPGPRGGAHWTAFADWMLLVGHRRPHDLRRRLRRLWPAAGNVRAADLQSRPRRATVAPLIQLAAPYFAPELEVITRARGRSRGVWLAAALAGGGTALMLLRLSCERPSLDPRSDHFAVLIWLGPRAEQAGLCASVRTA